MQTLSRTIRPQRHAAQRRGASIVVVLGVLSIALALSYAILRTQGTAVQIHKNSSRRGSARQAALTGMSVALATMHGSDWGGADAALTGSLSATETYSVAFVTGDASLDASSPDYADWPYRVTVTSTGYADSADSPGTPSTHVIQTVVRLAPRQLGATPSDWPAMLGYTVYQTINDTFTIELPCRIEGPARLQGRLYLAEAYPTYSPAQVRYLTDLNAMRQQGYGDYRPFNGPVSLPKTVQTGATLHDLGAKLGVSTVAISQQVPAADWVRPMSLVTYQLYAGGKSYTATTVGATLENVTLGANPQTNPLGLFWRSGSVTLRGNVTIRGTLLASNDILVDGANVTLEAVEQPLLDGASVPFRLPAAVCDDFHVTRDGRGTVTGVVAAWDDFHIQAGSEAASFAVVGRVVCGQFLIDQRDQWTFTDWYYHYERFQDLNVQTGAWQFFPNYMGARGRNPVPLLTVKPPSASVTDHWLTPGDPLYVPHSSDPGLRWNVVRWTDNP